MVGLGEGEVERKAVRKSGLLWMAVSLPQNQNNNLMSTYFMPGPGSGPGLGLEKESSFIIKYWGWGQVWLGGSRFFSTASMPLQARKYQCPGWVPYMQLLSWLWAVVPSMFLPPGEGTVTVNGPLFSPVFLTWRPLSRQSQVGVTY